MNSEYQTPPHPDPPISTPEIYDNILYSLKETNSFEGHLIKGHIANYICIDTN